MSSAQYNQEPCTWASRELSIPTKLGRINIREGGNETGSAMVFWPSLLMSGSMWRYQFEHYAPTHRVILIDAPGIGKSDPLVRIITIDECSDCLVEILNALGIDRCLLVGNSWGALLASVFAAWHPERLLGVVAACGTAMPATLIERIKMTPLIALIGLYRKAPGWLAAVARSNFAGDTAAKTKPEFCDFFRCILSEKPKSIAFQMKSILLGRKDNRALLQTIKGVPILVIAGEEDKQFPIPVVKRFAEAIPGSTFAVLPKTAHLPPLESPDLFNSEVDSFIAKQMSCHPV